MKNIELLHIELLPKWYKHSRQLQVSYRVQYAVLGCVFALMLVWNFSGVYSVSQASAELIALESKLSESQSLSHEFSGIKSEMAKLNQKADTLRKIDSRIDVASVLAEISFLIGKRIVLSEVRFDAESFKGISRSVSGARVARNVSKSNKTKGPLGDVRFKIVIRGVAAEASDVADLICKLEESPYFCQIIPSFSRNSRARSVSNILGSVNTASEFEIGCYLANYLQDEINKSNDKKAER